MIKAGDHLPRPLKNTRSLCMWIHLSRTYDLLISVGPFYLIRPGTARSNLSLLSASFRLVYLIEVRMESVINMHSSHSRFQETYEFTWINNTHTHIHAISTIEFRFLLPQHGVDKLLRNHAMDDLSRVSSSTFVSATN